MDLDLVWALGRRPDLAAALLREEVGRALGLPARDVELSRSCRHCGSSAHGRPVLLPPDQGDPLFLSLSRAGDLALVAVSRRGPVGVDVERVDAARFAGFEGVALHAAEVAPGVEARAITWVRKESLLKATGDGLQVDPRLVRLGPHDEPPRLVEWSATSVAPAYVWMQDLAIEGHAACVTVLTDQDPQVSLRQEGPGAPARRATPRTGR